MRAVIQRVNHACVRVEGEIAGQIEKGYLVLLGAGKGDKNALHPIGDITLPYL